MAISQGLQRHKNISSDERFQAPNYAGRAQIEVVFGTFCPSAFRGVRMQRCGDGVGNPSRRMLLSRALELDNAAHSSQLIDGLTVAV